VIERGGRDGTVTSPGRCFPEIPHRLFGANAGRGQRGGSGPGARRGKAHNVPVPDPPLGRRRKFKQSCVHQGYIQNFTQFANLFSVNYLLHAAWFFIPAATAIACFIVGLLKSSRLSTSIYFAIFVVDTLAAVLIYSQGDAHINMEKFFYPIAVIGMLSIGIYQWNGKKSVLASMDQIDEQPGAYAQNQTKAQSRTQQLISIPLWFLAFSMMLGIQKHLPNYAERKQLLFDLVKVQPHAKLLIQQPAEEQGANTNDTVAKIANALSQKGSLWGLSYETAIASKLIGLNETHTAKIMSPEEIKDWPTTHKQIADSLFIGAPFEQPQPINRLNHRYFRFAKNQYFASTPPTTSTTSPRLPPQ
jgi:hypothetical protein